MPLSADTLVRLGVPRDKARRHLPHLRDAMRVHLLAAMPELIPLGPEATTDALPQILALGVPGVTGEELVYALDQAGVAAASSSACLSGARSPVLDLVGLSEQAALMRLSLGWTSEARGIGPAAEAIVRALSHLRAQGPFERRRGPLSRRAEAFGVELTVAHLDAAEAVFGYYQAEGLLPGPRALDKLTVAHGQLDTLYPYGLSTLASWLGLPVPRGGCRPLSE